MGKLIERLMLLGGIVALFRGSPAARAADVDRPQVSFERKEADAASALRTLAEEQGLGLVARDLPPDRHTVTFSFSSQEEGLAVLAETYGLQATLWREMILAEPVRSQAPLSERLRSSIAPETAALLFRGPDDGSAEAEGFDRVVEAVRVLLGKESEDPEALSHAAYWMAGPELNSLLRQWDCVERGVTRCAIIDRRTVWGQPLLPDEDPCEQHLVFVAPAPGWGEGEEPLFLSFHGPSYDHFAVALAEEKGLIPLDEYKRRLLAAAKVREGPWGEPSKYETRLTVGLEGEGAWTDCLARLAQVAPPVSWSEKLEPGRFVVAVEEVEAGDLLIALALLAGGILLDAPESVFIDVPLTELEKLTAAFPLPWRAWVHATTVERDLARQRLVARLWPYLAPQSERPGPRGSVPLHALEPAAQALARGLAEISLAGLYRRWTENLPDRSGRVPLWLYESEELGWYEVAAPGRSEFLRDTIYRQIKHELAPGGGEVLP